jgi:branched-chain amino acid transport system substrate-binding protein
MRRGGSWLLGIIVVIAMAGGTWLGLRRLFRQETVTILSLLPRDGDYKPDTDEIVNGIKLALLECRNRIGRFVIRYEDRDLFWEHSSMMRPNGWPSEAGDAIRDPEIMAVIGAFHWGSSTQHVAELNRAKLVMISPVDTYPPLTEAGVGEREEPARYRPTGDVNFFRVVPPDDLQGAVGPPWAKKRGAKSVFIVYHKILEGPRIPERFREQALRTGLKVVGFEEILWGTPPYRTLLPNIVSANVDLVYIGATRGGVGAAIVRDLRNAGYKGALLLPDGCFHNDFLKGAGTAAEGAYFTSSFLPPPVDFQNTYREHFGTTGGHFAYYGYLACKRALEAFEEANFKDREAIRRACASNPYFSADGDPAAPAVGAYVVRDGHFEFVEELRKYLGQ